MYVIYLLTTWLLFISPVPFNVPLCFQLVLLVESKKNERNTVPLWNIMKNVENLCCSVITLQFYVRYNWTNNKNIRKPWKPNCNHRRCLYFTTFYRVCLFQFYFASSEGLSDANIAWLLTFILLQLRYLHRMQQTQTNSKCIYLIPKLHKMTMTTVI